MTCEGSRQVCLLFAGRFPCRRRAASPRASSRTRPGVTRARRDGTECGPSNVQRGRRVQRDRTRRARTWVSFGAHQDGRKLKARTTGTLAPLGAAPGKVVSLRQGALTHAALGCGPFSQWCMYAHWWGQQYLTVGFDFVTHQIRSSDFTKRLDSVGRS